MVNSEAIHKVANAIEQHSIKKLGFNMSAWVSTKLEDHSGHDCGTTACIGGWAIAVLDDLSPRKLRKKISKDETSLYAIRRVEELFNLTPEQANAPCLEFPSEAQPEDAVRVLRHLAIHGEVKW